MPLADAIQEFHSTPAILHGLRAEQVLEKMHDSISTMRETIERHRAEDDLTIVKQEIVPLSDEADQIDLEEVPRGVHVDRLPPDISYYLDCSSSFGHISPDTEYFVRHIYSDPVGLIENGLGRPSDLARGQTWLDYLKDRDRNLEVAYLDWRKNNREVARAVSVAVLAAGPRYIDHLIEQQTRDWVNDGLTRLPVGERARRFREDMSIYNRAYNRMVGDLSGLTRQEVSGLKERLYGLRNAYSLVPLIGKSKKVIRAQRLDLRKTRKMIRRSIAFLQQLLGSEPVRLFIGNEDLIIRGRLCDFALRKSYDCPSTYMYSHGGALCRILAKDGRFVSNLCIFSDNVPLLDHVASLVMHVQSGLEEEVLKTGNWYGVDRSVLKSLPDLIPFQSGALSDLLDHEDDYDLDDDDEIPNDAVRLRDLFLRGERPIRLIIGETAYRERLDRMTILARLLVPTRWFEELQPV